jgi:hypothetical protein
MIYTDDIQGGRVRIVRTQQNPSPSQRRIKAIGT